MASLHCCDDDASNAVLAEYSAILDEMVFAKPDEPATIEEVMAVVVSDRVTRYYTPGS